eukprot:6223202-Pyramimonas_sp.AAC.5
MTDPRGRGMESKSFSGSKMNAPEAALVAKLVLAALGARDVPPEEIAVITPYAGQVRMKTRPRRNFTKS